MYPPALDPPKPRLRRRWIMVAVAAVVLAAAIGATAWRLSVHHALSQVTVTPSSLRCNDKSVPLSIIRDGDSPPRPAFKPHISPASECWLTVAVVNGSGRSVHLTSMTFDAMMPGQSGRFSLEAPRDGTNEKPHAVDGSGDAIFDADETIPGGRWIELTYEIHYRSHAATCPDAIETTNRFPRARISAGGASADIHGSVRVAFRTVETDGNRGNCGK